MFQRVILENWHAMVPYIAFFLVAGSFLVILFRAVTMRRDEAESLARLPLDEPKSSRSEPPFHP